jgi:hypothetical protein
MKSKAANLKLQQFKARFFLNQISAFSHPPPPEGWRALRLPMMFHSYCWEAVGCFWGTDIVLGSARNPSACNSCGSGGSRCPQIAVRPDDDAAAARVLRGRRLGRHTPAGQRGPAGRPGNPALLLRHAVVPVPRSGARGWVGGQQRPLFPGRYSVEKWCTYFYH